MFAERPAQPDVSLRARHPRQARVVIVAAVVALLGLLLVLCDPRGVRQLRKLRRDLARQREANGALQRQNAELDRAARELSRGDRSRAAERAVREQLGFVRDDEVVFKFE